MAATLPPKDNSMETEYKTPPEKFAAFLKRQRMVFIVAFLGYVCAYLVRNNFKLMSKSIMVANDWNKDDIAMLLSCLTVSYGLAKFYMGALGDKMSLRKLFATCMGASAVICTIIGEGGSGGALAIAVGDFVNMLQYSTYSVISPEGCASILWKTAEKAADAAAALGITADRLQKLNLVDKVIEEPLGGAHRNHGELMQRLREVLAEQLRTAQDMPLSDLLDRRFDRIMAYGQFVEK